MIIELDYHSGIPPRRQIADAIALRILTGAIVADSELPDVRDLSRQLRVNPNTVRAAYRDLAELGLAALSDDSDGAVARAPSGDVEALATEVFGRSLERIASQARRAGLSPEAFQSIFDRIVRSAHDSDG